MQTIPLSEIQLSKTNPRRRRDEKADAELVESVRRHGVLQPVLVRPIEANGAPPWELVAGSRRFAAAKAAGLADIPAVSKDLTDVEALEVQVIENLQRADVHPLEEAEGYHQLSRHPGYDVATVAERVGRSVKYVYDRLKLLGLTKEAKQLFLDDRISAGHAILLARLKPADQARAIGPEGRLFETEDTLFDPLDGRPERSFKSCSVRELQAWIDEHVRFDAKAPDPMLFPQTVEEVAKAQKVVPITFSHFIAPAARDGRTFGPRAWKRADGHFKSKLCDLSITGVVMVGPRRGEAFPVCVAKEKCTVHWGAEIKKRKASAAARAKEAGRPSGKAPSPERDEVLAHALAAAHDAATDECARRIGDAAEAMKPEALLRSLARLDDWGLTEALDGMGEKVRGRGPAGAAAWVKSATLPKVQRAIALAQAERGSFAVVCAEFGVDAGAISKEHEKRAREAHRLQTSAQGGMAETKASPTKEKKQPGAKGETTRARKSR